MSTAISDALAVDLQLWQNTLVSWVRSPHPDLTNRQMALLMVISLDPTAHTVRGLADRLSVAKPVISRALDRLGELGYLKRVVDKRDRRNIFIVPTEAGRAFLGSFADLIDSSVKH